MTDEDYIMIHKFPEVYTAITKPENGEGFTLIWGDYVANEWEETYDTLALALMRLAVIASCRDGERMFAQQPLEFVARASEFIDRSLTD